MKKLKPEDVKSMSLVHRGNNSPVYLAVMAMEIGDILQIEPADWKQKTPPSVLIKRINKKKERHYTIAQIMSGGKGWIVRRLS